MVMQQSNLFSVWHFARSMVNSGSFILYNTTDASIIGTQIVDLTICSNRVYVIQLAMAIVNSSSKYLIFSVTDLFKGHLSGLHKRLSLLLSPPHGREGEPLTTSQKKGTVRFEFADTLFIS